MSPSVQFVIASFAYALLSTASAIAQQQIMPSVPLKVNSLVTTNSVPGDQTKVSTDARRLKIADAYVKLPLSFESNHGQTDGRFLSRGPGYSLFLTPTEAVLALSRLAEPGDVRLRATRRAATTVARPSARTAMLRMKLLGSNPQPSATALEELPGKSNYFIGNDPKQWRTNVPNYGRVRFGGVYPGVDLVYYGNQSQLEYDFVVAPGADPSAIRLGFVGAERMQVDSHGELTLQMRTGEVRWHKPIVYQEVGGKRQMLDGRYVRNGKGAVGFEVAAYDPRRALVIDPVLVYSTYLGGSFNDGGKAVAVDASGNAYVTGVTLSTNFPHTANAFQTTYLGSPSGGNVFVTKFNATGSALLYSTYLGGSGGGDFPFGIAIDSAGNAYVTGDTSSRDFPTASPFQPTFGGGNIDGFVTKLNAAGSALLYSTYLGGNGDDYAKGIAVDSTGNAYLTGYTWSANFPTANAFQATMVEGNEDVFVTKLNPAGSALVYSTYLGGSGFRRAEGRGIAVDSAGNAYVTGTTNFIDFPTTPNAFRASGSGDYWAFVTKLNAAGSALVYSTYLGATGLGGPDIADTGGIAIDSSGNAYVVGTTTYLTFPTTANAFQVAYGGGSSDAFVTKLNATGSGLVYSSYLGGSGSDFGVGIAVDSSGNAYVTGSTYSNSQSPNFPTADPFQAAYGGGGSDVFVAKVGVATGCSALIYSSYLGGSDFDLAGGIAVDSQGSAYVTGQTRSTDFPMASPFQAVPNGTDSVFVTKIGPSADPPTLSFISVTPVNPTIAQGATQQFGAAGTFSDGSEHDLTKCVTWGSGTPGVATIATGGLASGRVAGTSLITATSGGISGSTTLTVINPQAFDYDISASTLTQATPSTQTSTIRLSSNNGVSEAVQLSRTWGSPSPTNVTIAFSPNPVTVPSTGSVLATLTVTSSPSSSPGTFNLKITGTSTTGVTRSVDVTVVIAGSTPPPPAAELVLAAGPVGPRSFAVIDFTNPTSPTIVNPNPPYLGGSVVDCSGANAALGNQNGGQVVIYNLSNPASPAKLGSIDTGLGGIGAIKLDGNRVLVGEMNGYRVDLIDLSDPSSPVIRSTMNTGIAGVSSVALSGSKAVVSGPNNITMDIIDYTDPAQPTRSSFDPKIVTGLPGLTVDLDGSSAAVGTQYNATIALVDITGPSVLGTVSSGLSGVAGQQNLSISIKGSQVAVGSSNYFNVALIDFTNPSSPAVSDFNPNAGGGWTVSRTTQRLAIGNITGSDVELFSLSGNSATLLGNVNSNVASPSTICILEINANTTPVGSNIAVQPKDTPTGKSPVTVTFPAVNQAGETTLTISNSGPAPKDNFKLGSPATYYDLTTTALFTPPATVCFSYAGVQYSNPSSIQLFHYVNNSWVQITTFNDTVDQIICGMTNSFSPFALFEPVDSIPPTTSMLVSPQPNAAGWNNHDVTITFNAADEPGGSGVQSITYSISSNGGQAQAITVNAASAQFTISQEGTTTITFFATDNAGNAENTHTLVIKLDKTPPMITCASPDGHWHASDVSLACTGSDAGSGLANPADASFSLSTHVAAGAETTNAATDTRQVCDNAGNCTIAGPIAGNEIDRKPPSIFITAPAGTYLLGQIVAANYSCADGGSGIALCNGPVSSGAHIGTGTVGAKSFSVISADQVGNTSSSLASYTVSYGICPLYDKSFAKKSGSAYPIKIQLCDADGNNVSSSSIVVHAVSVTQVSTNSPATLDDTGDANPDFDFRYDATLQGYIFNLSTQGYASGTYTLNFTAGSDPAQHSAIFAIK